MMGSRSAKPDIAAPGPGIAAHPSSPSVHPTQSIAAPGPGIAAHPNQNAPDQAAHVLTPEQQDIVAQMEKILAGYRDSEDYDVVKHVADAEAAIQKAKAA